MSLLSPSFRFSLNAGLSTAIGMVPKVCNCFASRCSFYLTCCKEGSVFDDCTSTF